MQKYLVIIEDAGRNFSAFSPDIPGCTATGETVEATMIEMKAALEFHLEDEEELPAAKGIAQHISEGIFEQESIAGQFFITEIELSQHQHV